MGLVSAPAARPFVWADGILGNLFPAGRLIVVPPGRTPWIRHLPADSHPCNKPPTLARVGDVGLRRCDRCCLV